MPTTDQILTTHTGSLPRPEDLAKRMLARESGRDVDQAAFEDRVRAAVVDVVGRQAGAGIHIVGDGELSKPSYATYVKDRLAGFEGPSAFPSAMDLGEFPGYAQRVLGEVALGAIRVPACTGPIAYRGAHALAQDLRNLTEALEGAKVEGAFLTAASPGVVALFHQNHYYARREDYLEAIAAAMRVEYLAILDAGFLLQIDCPDLAMGRHVGHARLPAEEFVRIVGLHVEALNRAVAGLPAHRMRIHLCYGNYEGPHHLDVALRDILPLVLRAAPAGLSFPVANPRHAHEWRVFEDFPLPDGKFLIPGVVDPTTNFIEHPELVAERIVRLAELVGRENVIAGTDCGFSTFVGLSAVDPAIAWSKLAALSEGARLASRVLWRRTTVSPGPRGRAAQAGVSSRTDRGLSREK